MAENANSTLTLQSLLETVDSTFDETFDNSDNLGKLEKPFKTCSKAPPKQKPEPNSHERVPETFTWDKKSKDDYIRRINIAEEKRKEEMKTRDERRKAYREMMREKIIKSPQQQEFIEYNSLEHIKGKYGPTKRYGPHTI